MSCAACKGVRGDGNTCRFCGEYSPSDRDRLMAEQNRLIGEQNHLLERIAVALEPVTYTINTPVIQTSGLNTTSTGVGMVHPMQNSPVCGICGSGGGQHDDGCANER